MAHQILFGANFKYDVRLMYQDKGHLLLNVHIVLLHKIVIAFEVHEVFTYARAILAAG